MADVKKLLRGILSKAYKLDNGTIDEIIAMESDDDAETKLIDLDAERVTTLSTPKKGQTYQDGFKAAKKEVLTALEGQIKDKYGVDTDVTGVEAIVEAVIEEKAKSGANKGALTDDDVKKHPAYQQMERSFKKQLTDKDTELTTKLTEKEKEITRTQIITQVKTNALTDLTGLNPIFPKSQTVADNLKNTYLKEFEQYDYEGEGQDAVVLKDGKVLTDKHGHSITLKDLTKQLAGNYFEFENNNGGSNGGNDNNNDQGGGSGGDGYPAGINKPNNLEELSKIANDDKIPVADRQKVIEVFEAENSR